MPNQEKCSRSLSMVLGWELPPIGKIKDWLESGLNALLLASICIPTHSFDG